MASSWWGYAEADPTVVGLLVGAISALAVIYVVIRITRSRARSRAGKRAGGSRG